MVYEYGAVARISGDFFTVSDSTKTYFDPDVVIVKVTTPSGVTTTYQYLVDDEVEKESTGKYYMDIEVDEAGRWYYQFKSTGARIAAAESFLTVLETEF